ncbi:hypothetical protein QBC39DRAFT_110620 [Podospora conica]|nr:hypothetical protein QBC39DRAFT_110620 [Schizothecium conicum]
MSSLESLCRSTRSFFSHTGPARSTLTTPGPRSCWTQDEDLRQVHVAAKPNLPPPTSRQATFCGALNVLNRTSPKAVQREGFARPSAGTEILHIRVRSAVQRSAAVCQRLHLLDSWDGRESCAWTLLLQQSCRRGQPPWGFWRSPSTPTFQVKRRRPRSAKIGPSTLHRHARWCPTRTLSVRAGCDAHLRLPQLGMPLGEPTTAGLGATAAAERLNHMGAARAARPLPSGSVTGADDRSPSTTSSMAAIPSL